MRKEIQELTEGMQRLCAVANRVVAGQGKASRIETDLLLDNLRGLYDIALRLQQSDERRTVSDEMAMMSTMAAMTAPVAEPSATAQPATAPAAEAPALEAAPAPEPVVSERPEPAPAPAAPAPEPQAAPAPEAPAPMPSVEDLEDNGNALLFDEVVIESPAAPEPPAPAPKPAKKAAPAHKAAPKEPTPKEPEGGASLLDYLKQPAGRILGESLVAAAPTLASLEKKVDDLRTVININDKFSFMSELFKGNMKAYNDFIMRLNATEGREEALEAVRDVAAQYKWDDGSATVKTFYKIFDKKF